MKHWLSIAIVLLLLAGCGFTATGDAVRGLATTKGAQAYDEGLENAVWFQCQMASVGSVQRYFGRSEEFASAWRTLCLDNPDARIIVPLRPE